MTTEETSSFKRRDSTRTQRKAISLSTDELVKIGPLLPDSELPLQIEPNVPGIDLTAWVAQNRERLQQQLLRHGGILFRGFQSTLADFEAVMEAFSGKPETDPMRGSPLRNDTNSNVYISTEYPPQFSISLHNETWWQYIWPMKIFFYCHTAAREGGETPIADCRRVLARLDPALVQRFVDQGVLCIRNFGARFGRPWQPTFETEDRAVVEDFCRKNRIEFEWRDDDWLRTRHIRPAVTNHPQTGEALWFNTITHQHVSSQFDAAADRREQLLAAFGEDHAPFNTYYGDGSPIEPEVLEAIRTAYREESVAFPWQEGDILMLDNMLVAHGRRPFVGPRKILVGMTEPHTLA